MLWVTKMKVLRSTGAQPQQVLLELAARLLVDGRERLVHQQHLGIDGERAGQADALAHAARQLVRIALSRSLRGRPRRYSAARDLLALRSRHAAQLQPEGDVAQHGRPGHQREVLEHEGALRTRARRPSAGRRSPRRRVGCSRPAMILSSVVLPQPLGPSSEVSLPARESRDRCRAAPRRRRDRSCRCRAPPRCRRLGGGVRAVERQLVQRAHHQDLVFSGRNSALSSRCSSAQRQRREQDDRGDGGVHLGVVGDRRGDR